MHTHTHTHIFCLNLGIRLQIITDLKEAVTRKDQFMSLMSHELRTPLNGIIQLGDALCRGAGVWEVVYLHLFVFVSVYMCACVYVCVHGLCLCLYTCVCACVCVCVCMCTQCKGGCVTHACQGCLPLIHIIHEGTFPAEGQRCGRMCVYMCVRVFICVRVCMCVFACACVCARNARDGCHTFDEPCLWVASSIQGDASREVWGGEGIERACAI